jgi:hypothetical protein
MDILTLKLTAQQMDTVINGLHQLPHGTVRATFDEVAKQLQEQINDRQKRDSAEASDR